MPRLIKSQSNLSRGELNPRAHMRFDTRVYNDAVETAQNVCLLAHGGGRRRPGLRYLADLSSLGDVRFHLFDYGPGQAYLFIFYNAGLRVYLTDGTLATTLTSQPWTTAMLPKLSFAQAGNVLLVTHQDMTPREIRRTGATSFSSTDFEFASGGATPGDAPTFQPFFRFFDTLDVTIAPNTYSAGSVTVTSNPGIFTAAWVDKIIRYGGTEIELTGYTNATTMTGTAREVLAKAYSYPVTDSSGFVIGQRVKCTSGDAEGVVISKPDGTHVGVLMLDRAIAWEFEASVLRYLVSGTTTSKLTAAGSLIGTPPATTEWDETVFSPHRGWPVCCAFHEQRFYVGGSRDLPNRIWVSAVADFWNFSEGLGEDDAGFAVEVTNTSEIRHMISQRHLHVLCNGGEFYVPQTGSAPITVSNVNVQRQTTYGCTWVRPVIFDGATLFVQLSGRAIREFIFTDQETAYASYPLSVMSSHLIYGPVDMDAQVGADDIEEQYVYVVNQDGTMAVYHGMKKEEVAGWTRWTTDGKFKAVRCVDGFMFFAVERTIGGSTKLYLERLDPELTVDCALALGAATPEPAAAHLPGKVLHAVDGTAYYGSWEADALGLTPAPLPHTVPAGAEIGLDYPFKIVDLPVVEAGGQNVATMPKRIVLVSVWIDQSVTFRVNGHVLAVYNAGDDLSAVPNPRTGAYEFRLLGYTRTGQVTIEQQYPLPLTVLGLHKEVSV